MLDFFKSIKTRPELLIYIYFVIAASFLAVIIKFGVGPDEIYHHDFIKYYGANSADPFITSQTYAYYLGELTREPAYLYHYLLSFPYRIADFLGINTVVFLRFINIFFGLLSLIVLNRLALTLKLGNYIRFASLLFIANIPMFLFLSSSINYDNLIIFLSVLSLLLLIQLSKSFNALRFLLASLIMVAGPLIKHSFLPISTAIFIFLVIILFKNRRDIYGKSLAIVKKRKITSILLAVLVIISTGLFLERYVQNYLQYSTYAPKCHKIIEIEKCRQSALLADGEKVRKFAPKIESVNPVTYLPKWLTIMNSRIFGVFSHEKFQENKTIMQATFVVLVVTFLLFIRWFKFRKDLFAYVIPVAFVIYTAALIYTNMKSYKISSDINRAVQGRYWLPVLLPFFIYVASLRKFNIYPNKLFFKTVFVITVIGIFAMGMPNILHGIDQSWIR